MSPVNVSVLVPVYGSASILPQLVEQLDRVFSARKELQPFEVLLVHDAGPDNAWEVIERLAGHRPWLRAIDLRKNAGQHNALMAGLHYSRGCYIVTMDDDLQHSPEDVPRVVEALKLGADVCYVKFEGRKHAAWKRLGSWFNDFVARRLLRKPKGLYLSPFRGLVRELRDEVIKYEGPFVYLDGLLLRSTDNIATISGQHHVRIDGRSGYSLRKSISLWLQMATSFSIFPLRLVSIAGFVASMLAFVIALIVLVQKLRVPEMAVGWPSLIVTILLIGGIQLLALGMVGEYTGRVLLNLNKRPQFVVRRRIDTSPVEGSADPTSDHAEIAKPLSL